MDSPNTDQDWSNYWQGRAANESGAALVGVGIENDAEIAAFWDEQLAAFDKNCRFLDMACGAGSVIRRAQEGGFTDITGLDYSPGAIDALKMACPDVTGVTASAKDTGLSDAAFDVVVSQFGFEYAGAVETATEIARLLARGGSFIALSHKQGSAIETEVVEKRDEVKAIMDTHFIERAKVLFAAYALSDADFNAALAAFRGPQDRLLDLAKLKGGFAAHLYSGTQTLFNKRLSYTLEDVHGWLDGMTEELSAYGGRMQSMIDAALSSNDVNGVSAALKDHGLQVKPPEVFMTGFQQDEIGWIIRANKQA